MILVTGASGHLGELIINNLLQKVSPDEFVALTRNEAKAAELQAKGINTRIGDFDQPETMERAFQGIDKALIISTMSPNRYEQQAAVVDAAKRAGVKHLIYTGVTIKDVSLSVLKAHMDTHFQTEDYIRNNGFTYTFLRNSLYAEVIPLHAGEKVFEHGINLPGGEGKVSYALRSEMAEAAANVLAGEGHENKVYHITGAELYSYREVAETLTSLSGKQVLYRDADEATFVSNLLQAGVPQRIAVIKNGFAVDIKHGLYEVVSPDLENLLGRKPALLKEMLKQIYHL